MWSVFVKTHDAEGDRLHLKLFKMDVTNFEWTTRGLPSPDFNFLEWNCVHQCSLIVVLSDVLQLGVCVCVLQRDGCSQDYAEVWLSGRPGPGQAWTGAEYSSVSGENKQTGWEDHRWRLDRKEWAHACNQSHSLITSTFIHDKRKFGLTLALFLTVE